MNITRNKILLAISIFTLIVGCSDEENLLVVEPITIEKGIPIQGNYTDGLYDIKEYYEIHDSNIHPKMGIEYKQGWIEVVDGINITITLELNDDSGDKVVKKYLDYNNGEFYAGDASKNLVGNKFKTINPEGYRLEMTSPVTNLTHCYIFGK